MSAVATPSRRLVQAAGLFIIALALWACHATVQDACNHLADCTRKNDPQHPPTQADIDSCVATFQKDEAQNVCGAAQVEVYDCLAGIQCETKTSTFGEIIDCAGRCPNQQPAAGGADGGTSDAGSSDGGR